MPQLDAHLEKYSLEGPDDACGDTGVIKLGGKTAFVALIDVLGHGNKAHQVALMAEEFLAENYKSNLVDLTWRLHKHLKGTRGAVAAMCRVNLQNRQLSYVGVGNINTRIYGGGAYKFVPRGGILGFRSPTPKELKVDFHVGDTLVLTSDGVRENFDLLDYPGLLTGSAGDIAKKIIHHLGKGTDDACCLVLRN
ncbi:SpoIIE family protein phosphatase [Dethiosulfatarculus sandiegensis]|uniref:PPM-type phosphatase domain-containing protein n=1 Tax=Dethiosulfatarculus sandiegensis TaxID=1429043 RepID=A0A0D2HQA9_9BACT|nr:SpoIIE family protein phosphatase [Dethiosulfatarculus sandiegensis]KIX12663.1 hypothetical protein X474_17930 [Dethiosulfatarculus sandiegensis]